MAGSKTTSKRPKKKNSALNLFLTGILLVILACGAGLAWFIFNKETERHQELAAQQKREEAAVRAAFENAPPTTIINDSIKETVRAAALKGWKPCPNRECLTLAKPPWRHKEIEGFAASDYWHEYTYTDGGWGAFSQRHIGHIIKYHPDRRADDVGTCPVCNGKGWVPKDFVY